MEIQELTSRGRFLFFGAPKRLEVFKFVNGKRGAKDIARKSGRTFVQTLQDLRKMRDLELIKPKLDKKGKVVKGQGSTVFEKIPLLRHVSIRYFQDPIKANKRLGKQVQAKQKRVKDRQLQRISIPTEEQILDICRTGEDQLYEFKRAKTEIRKITKEICAFANTKLGGIIFYGIDDDGTVSGSDKHRQELDQSLQNSIKNSISPTLIVAIKERDLLGQKVLLIIVPPWNRRDIYYYEGRVVIRKGTNVFIATPEECRKLHNRLYVI